MVGGRLLIGLLCSLEEGSSAPPSDCLFCLRLQPPAETCAPLFDFFFTSPFIGLSSPKTLLDGLSELLFSHEKLQKSLELDTTSSPPSDFFCISELLRCLCRKDPLITFYWPVKLWPPIRVPSRPSQGLRGTPTALCWVREWVSWFDLFRLPLSYLESINTWYQLLPLDAWI